MNEDDNIMLVGLISGNTIVTRAEATDGNAMQLTQPLAIVQMADQVNDRTTLAFVPYAPYAEKGEIMLSASAIEYIAVPKQALIDQYKSAFSGIVIPNKSVIAQI